MTKKYLVKYNKSRFKKYLISVILILIFLVTLFTAKEPDLQAANNEDELLQFFPAYNYSQQPAIIENLLTKEENIQHLKNLIVTIKFCDSVYGNIPERLSKGEKLVIFLDPAHGKLASGQWQGSVTGRMSTIGLPEEYYSIKMARAFYNYVKKNDFLELKSTPDFMTVLDNKSEYYNNISFNETLKLATETGAFIIVSEHLNNVASMYKKDGLINMSGIHVTLDDNGTRYLTNIRDVYKGFLTLFNKYDASGFSRRYAQLIKDDLVAKGLTPNSWDYGTVADDRFIYFNDYPVSVIYESGFISNLQEEALFQKDDYCKKIAETHYTAMLGSIKEIFGIDISGYNYKVLNNNYDTTLTALKLSRIVMYYLNNGSPEKALNAVSALVTLPGYKGAGQLAYYQQMETKLRKMVRYQKDAQAFVKKKRYNDAYNSLVSANNQIDDSPVYYQLNYYLNLEVKKLAPYLKKKRTNIGLRIPRSNNSDLVTITPAEIKETNPAKTRTIILAVNENETLTDALSRALAPTDPTIITTMEKNLRAALVNRETYQTYYSKKYKKNITKKVIKKQKISYGKGIYLIRINSKLQVKGVEQVNRVLLNPQLYQNAEYLRNSYFSQAQPVNGAK